MAHRIRETQGQLVAYFHRERHIILEIGVDGGIRELEVVREFGRGCHDLLAFDLALHDTASFGRTLNLEEAVRRLQSRRRPT